MDWERDLPTWPLHQFSSRVLCKPHHWHVQVMGEGRDILLLHGAGGATQSWRKLIPRLARYGRVIAVDLPGQGFTRLGDRTRCSILAMRDDIARLCEQEGWRPRIIVGHSAGGALGLTLTDRLGAEYLVCFNAALGRFEGMAGWLFPVLAKTVSVTPFFSTLFAATSGRPAQIERLLASTGSSFDDETVDLYARLASDRMHVDGTLKMMAQWDIAPAEDALVTQTAATLFVVGENDGTVPPKISEKAAATAFGARLVRVPATGHLLHEEAPDRAEAEIRAFCNLG